MPAAPWVAATLTSAPAFPLAPYPAALRPTFRCRLAFSRGRLRVRLAKLFPFGLVLFLNLVEIPHMHKLYSETELRGEGPLPRALAKVTQTVSKSIVPRSAAFSSVSSS